MRYELKDGYVSKVFFGCHSGKCTLYEGIIPDGYETLEQWADNANIRAYKIVDGNLVFDEEEDARLQEEYEELSNTYSTREKKIGTWINGKSVYRKVVDIDYITLVAGENTIEHGISNMETVVRMDLILRYINEEWYYNWDQYRNITIDYSKITISIDSGYANSDWNGGHIIIEYTKTTD
jgi:hypothetical protein